MIGQTCDERYLKIWTRPDYALQCGDFIRVTIASTPYDGQYDMRILNKAFDSALYSDVIDSQAISEQMQSLLERIRRLEDADNGGWI
jgi:hypothetical protein